MGQSATIGENWAAISSVNSECVSLQAVDFILKIWTQVLSGSKELFKVASFRQVRSIFNVKNVQQWSTPTSFNSVATLRRHIGKFLEKAIAFITPPSRGKLIIYELRIRREV